MATMAQGVERIPDGSYVRVCERLPEGAAREPRHFVGKVVGTDMGRTKYQIGARYGGWGEWLFADGGSWAFPGEVAVISEAEALAVEEQTYA
jgi:hypothetical protein